MTTIRVPASTSNLGPGFDSHGLALSLYLTVEIDLIEAPFGTFSFSGEGAEELKSAAEENLIFRAMRFAASREEVELRPARLAVRNEIPLARGLGSSGAAIVAGLSAFEVISGRKLSTEKLLSYATEIEGHSDNVSAALLGSFVVSCVTETGGVVAARVDWPAEIHAVVVVPEIKVRTEDARAALPESVPLSDAVFNLQRASLLVAAVTCRQFDLISEALKDRLHQPYRAPLIPALDAVLDLGRDGRLPGLLGIALSGSGPSVVALAEDNFEQIGSAVSKCFEKAGIQARARELLIEESGRMVY